MINKRYQDVKLIVSVDRLDYIKGIPLRIDAMEAFLTQHPEYIGKVVLLQLLIPSREDVEGYRNLHNQIDEGVSRINGKFGSYLQTSPAFDPPLTLLTGDIEFSPARASWSIAAVRVCRGC
jgi:trehalose-6-phosphate synthase